MEAQQNYPSAISTFVTIGRGRRQNRKGDLTKSLIPKLKTELFKLKTEGREDSEDYRKLLARIEKTTEDDLRRKKAHKRKKDQANEEAFVKSDKTGMRFYDFIR